jgi:ceramide glucosyltransferase
MCREAALIALLSCFLWWPALGLTVAAIAYLLLALASVVIWRPQLGSGWSIAPRATLLKPMCGCEDGLDEAVASFLSQETDSPVRFVFGFADGDDPALQVCKGVAARFPDRHVSFVIDATMHGPNPKVSNLINMAETGLDEVVVLSDSDVVIAPGVLQRAIDSLAAPRVGAVTALYRSRPGLAREPTRTFGAWYLDYWFLPMAVLHDMLMPLNVTYGPLTAVKREVLVSIGGLEALAAHLSDDARLGELIRDAGFDVIFTPDVVETLVNDASHPELFDHELRWARTVRGLAPAGYIASVVSYPGPLPLLLLMRPNLLAMAVIMMPLSLRWLLVRLVERRFGRAEGLRRPGLFAIWLRDVYSFWVWVAGFVVGRVGWRGQKLSVHYRDILQHAPVPEQLR